MENNTNDQQSNDYSNQLNQNNNTVSQIIFYVEFQSRGQPVIQFIEQSANAINIIQ
jgi:hypothetical protein